jgi:hypothetical protein
VAGRQARGPGQGRRRRRRAPERPERGRHRLEDDPTLTPRRGARQARERFVRAIAHGNKAGPIGGGAGGGGGGHYGDGYGHGGYAGGPGGGSQAALRPGAAPSSVAGGGGGGGGQGGPRRQRLTATRRRRWLQRRAGCPGRWCTAEKATIEIVALMFQSILAEERIAARRRHARLVRAAADAAGARPAWRWIVAMFQSILSSGRQMRCCEQPEFFGTLRIRPADRPHGLLRAGLRLRRHQPAASSRPRSSAWCRSSSNTPRPAGACSSWSTTNSRSSSPASSPRRATPSAGQRRPAGGAEGDDGDPVHHRAAQDAQRRAGARGDPRVPVQGLGRGAGRGRRAQRAAARRDAGAEEVGRRPGLGRQRQAQPQRPRQGHPGPAGPAGTRCAGHDAAGLQAADRRTTSR